MKLAIALLLVCLFSCREVVEVSRPPVVTNYDAFITKASPYVKDESLDVFASQPWYAYDESNHIIWPIFRVYALKANRQYYKVQIVDYYNDRSEPGNYTLRIQPEGRKAFEWDFEAQGCGNVYTNLNFKECKRDPNQNIYTYLNFENQTSWKMPDVEARLRSDWHMAFNGTDVKINAGNQGPGDARIGDLYLFGGFFFNGAIDFQEVAEVSFSDKGKRFFDLNLGVTQATFALPPGVERVINESDWFAETRGSRLAKADSWWVVKGGEGDTFSKFHFKSIDETKEGEKITTAMTLDYFYQGVGENEFSTDLKSWKLPPFSTDDEFLQWCLDFDSQSVIECSDERWDIRLSVLNFDGIREWFIAVNVGALGPLSNEIATGLGRAP